MKLKLVAVFVAASILTGCASVGGIFDVLFGSSRQRATREPIYVYKADLWLNVDDVWFEGVGVTLLRDPVVIKVRSQININRVEVETCARLKVCEFGKPCDADFKIDSGWWGNAGRDMSYTYTPSSAELAESCPVFIRVYDKKVLAAWGYLAGRNGEDLPAKMACNGEEVKFSAHSVCNPKSGLINELKFHEPIEEFSADPQCHMKQMSDTKFEIRSEMGLCTGKFYANKKWHGMDVIGFEEVLVRQ